MAAVRMTLHMELVVRAFPLPQSSIEELRAFSHELLRRRKRDTDNLFRRFGIVAESWEIHRAPHGAVLVLTTWMSDVDHSQRALAASRDPFHVWFKQQLHRICGFEPAGEPLGRSPEVVFEWKDGPKAALPARRAGGSKVVARRPARKHSKPTRSGR